MTVAQFNLTEIAEERRRRARVRLACPVRLLREDRADAADSWTEDISCQGFSCVTPVPFSVGEVLDCELSLEHGGWIGIPGALVLQGKAEVMRVRKLAGAVFSLGCRLLTYTSHQRYPNVGHEDHSILTRQVAVR